MIAICYVTNTTYDTDKFRIVNVVRYGKDDALESDEVSPYGIDSNPIKDIGAAHINSTVMGEDVIIGYFLKNKKAAQGETRIYSTDTDGVEKARIWLHANGDIELGGTGNANSNTNHAAQYEGLQTAFNQLKSDFNDLVTKYNSHTHPYVDSGSPSTTSPTTSTDSPSTADISGAKLDKIKTQ